MTERQPPRFTGVTTYTDPIGRFTFRYPTDWHQFELDNGLDGTMFSPHAEEPQTWFAAWVSGLDTSIVAEDLDDLRAGVDEGLAQMAQFQSELASEEIFGNLIKFERIYTFEDNGVTRKRKVYILYVDHWVFVFTYQGETPEEWKYWLPMGNYSFFTINLPPELWFATDRTLSGLPKQELDASRPL